MKHVAVSFLLALSTVAVVPVDKLLAPRARAANAAATSADKQYEVEDGKVDPAFENHVAAIVARALGVPVEYTWYLQIAGFPRNTLLAHRCDVVMGLPSGGGDARTTPAYYRIGYLLMTRAADGIAVTSLADTAFAALQFGVVADTPPVDLLVARDFIVQAKVYPLIVDTHHDSPALAMMCDVADASIDASLV